MSDMKYNRNNYLGVIVRYIENNFSAFLDAGFLFTMFHFQQIRQRIFNIFSKTISLTFPDSIWFEFGMEPVLFEVEKSSFARKLKFLISYLKQVDY